LEPALSDAGATYAAASRGHILGIVQCLQRNRLKQDHRGGNVAGAVV
jgi:hypothetical protein